jgi:hypothetical protein
MYRRRTRGPRPFPALEIGGQSTPGATIVLGRIVKMPFRAARHFVSHGNPAMDMGGKDM